MDMQQLILEELSPIIGLTLTTARRAANMRTVQFGGLRPPGRGSVGDYALQIHCPWRIDCADGIVTGSNDLWEPAEREPDFDYADWDYDSSLNVQDMQMHLLLTRLGDALRVNAIDADNLGGLEVMFESGHTLRLFPAGTRGEDWRFFRPGSEEPHLVIAGGRIEQEAEDD
ncbi:MAG: hypothetical protein GC159_21395 [Phycisphaera sp.]|nr:hypothetical protein [Phycisphaera sp.]